MTAKQVIDFCNAQDIDECYEAIMWLPHDDWKLLMNEFRASPDNRFCSVLYTMLMTLINYGLNGFKYEKHMSVLS